jgi:hypothetical protein
MWSPAATDAHWVLCEIKEFEHFVIPAQAGIQTAPLFSRLRGNDGLT